MVDIKGREDVVRPEGVLDLEPYLRAVAGELAPLELLPDRPPAAVYQTSDGCFDHVLYSCNRSNVYLVVVVAVREGQVHGHFVLDLAEEYGLPPDA
jgi:hypothetical protein